MKSLYLVAGLTVSMLLLGACGSGSGGEEASKPESLAERLFGSTESIRNEEARVQTLIKQCMEQQGWQYTVTDPASNIVELDLNSEQFAKENGYGVSTLFGTGVGFTPADDPNQKYIEALSERDREAYQRALYGELPPSTGGESGQAAIVGVGSLGGCLGKANKEVRGDQAEPDPKVFEQLADVEKRVQADPRMVQAWAKWSECMAKSGFRYRNEDAVRADLQARLTKITGANFGSGFGGGGVVAIPGRSGGVADSLGQPDYDQAALAALQSDERRIASAGFACRAEHVSKVEERVRADVEKAFLDEHPDLGGTR